MEFGKGRLEKDEQKIEALKANAIRALSNYMLYESGTKDVKLGKAMKKFNDNTNKGIVHDHRNKKNQKNKNKGWFQVGTLIIEKEQYYCYYNGRMERSFL